MQQDQENTEVESNSLEGKRIKVTIVVYMDNLDRQNYQYAGEDGEELTPEEINALTVDDICRMEQEMLRDGVIGLDEIASNADLKNVTFEVTDVDA